VTLDCLVAACFVHLLPFCAALLLLAQQRCCMRAMQQTSPIMLCSVQTQ